MRHRRARQSRNRRLIIPLKKATLHPVRFAIKMTMAEFDKHVEEVLKDMYYSEEDRKDHLTQTLSVSIGVATVYAGIAVYYLSFLSLLDESRWICALVIFDAVILVGVITASILLKRAWLWHEYAYTKTPIEIELYADGLKKYYEGYVASSADDADAEFTKVLIKSYANCAQKNRSINDTKVVHQRRANKVLAAVGIIVLLSLWPYIMVQLRPTKPAQVEVVNPKG